jgi:hypothetical protein
MVDPTKALGKPGNIVVETFVILDISSNFSVLVLCTQVNMMLVVLL